MQSVAENSGEFQLLRTLVKRNLIVQRGIQTYHNCTKPRMARFGRSSHNNNNNLNVVR